ncbi:MAG: MG2 domain-containing protein, partial [Gammaproteobacteria bacterium]|nr:MG2 domain-containing protein [Gammaproteobacteria bacterium]
NYENGPAIGVRFSVPVDARKPFTEYLSVSIHNGERVEGGWVLSDTGTTAYFTNIEASRTYSVTVYQGINSITAQKLDKDYNRNVTTRPLQNMVSFASTGHVIPTGSAKGLPLVTVNIPSVDIDFFHVEEEKVDNFLANWSDNFNTSIEAINNNAHNMQLVHTARFDLNPPKNKRHRVLIPVKSIAALQKPGIYVAIMRLPGEYKSEYQASYFFVSDLGLHARFYSNRIDVYVNSIQSAKPLPAVDLKLIGPSGKILGETKTTPEGIASFFNLSTQARYVVATKQNYYGLLRLKSPALDLSEFNLGERVNRKTEVYIYSHRDLYRPGEKAVFNALIRNENGEYEASPALQAVIRQPDRREALNTKWHGNDLGYYSDEFEIPKDAKTGDWTLTLRIGSQQVGEYKFKVEEFLPERLKLTLDDGLKRPHFITDVRSNLNVPVNGQYLYGAPAASNKVDGFATIRQKRNPVEKYDDFFFGNVADYSQQQKFNINPLFLNEKGLASLEVRNVWSNVKSPLDIHVVSSLYESGGRPVVRGMHYTSWPSKYLVGIRPLFEEKDLNKNSVAEFEVILSDHEGNLKSSDKLDVRVVRDWRNAFWVYTQSRGWHYDYTNNNYDAFNGTVKIGADKRGKIRIPVESGRYRIEITDPETDLVTSHWFQAGRSYTNTNTQQMVRPDQILLTLDKKHY